MKSLLYLDSWVPYILLQEFGNAFGVILRFSDDVMRLSCESDFLAYGSSGLLIAGTNAAYTGLTALDLRQLFDEVLATGTSIPGFG